MNKSTASSRQTQAKPPKPQALAVQPEHIPDPLKALPQLVTWRYTWLPDRQKWDKPPLNARTGKAASSTNPKTWSTFEVALACYRKNRKTLDGIGFVLCKDNQIVGIDLDHCRDPDTGVIEDWALDIVAAFDTYTEISPSGTGLRCFAKGTLPWQRAEEGRHRNLQPGVPGVIRGKFSVRKRRRNHRRSPGTITFKKTRRCAVSDFTREERCHRTGQQNLQRHTGLEAIVTI